MDFPSAAISAPPIQYPDLIGSYLRGQMGGAQAQMIPGQMQEQQNALAQQGLSLDQLRMTLANQRAYQQVAFSQLGAQGYNVGDGAPSGYAGAGAQSGASASGGIQTGPQGSVSAGAPRTAPTMPSGSYNGSIGGMQPSTLGALAILRGDDPLKTAQGVADYQKSQAQLQAQGPIDLIDSVFNSAAPARTVMMNPSLMAQWPKFAAQLGMDPVKDFNDVNVRAALALAGNGIRGNVGMPAKEYPVPLRTTQRGLGESIQTEPVTGKISAGAPAVATDKFIVNGRVVEMPKAQGVAQGATPYDPSLYGASLITPQANEQAYQQAKATGTMPALAGRDPIAFAQEASYIAKRSADEGVTGLSMAARAQTYKAQQAVVDDFTGGKTATNINGINTAVQHMNLLGPLVDAMGTGNEQLINRARNAWQQQTGSPAPTNYAAIKEFVGGEVAKAVLPGGGGEGERDALLAPLNAANSPQQLHEAVGQMQRALAGKTEALRNQWNVGTGGTQGSFDKFLMPSTQSALGGSGDHPPAIKAILDRYPKK